MATPDEDELGLSRRMAQVFEQAPVGIAVTVGPEHRYEFASTSYRALVPGRVTIGKTLMENFPELADQGIEEIFDGVYASGKAFSTHMLRVNLWSVEHDRMEERYFDLVYQPLLGPDGKPDGIAIVAFDVHELTEAKRQAEAANKTKDEFIAMLGHELRNPLAPIVTALHLLQLRHGEDGAAERGVIERQVKHMVRLVDDLLDVARITRGHVELDKAVTEIWAVVATAVETSAPLFEEKRHELQLNVPARGLKVFADSVRLCQVVSNILTNAARYTPTGGRIVVSAARSGEQVVLSVADNGVGMSPSELTQVFELFAQGRQGVDRPQGGLGLGLTIARNLAALHGGQLTARSAGEGQGSVFELRLPLSTAKDRALTAAPVANPADAIGQNRRVLLVDDNVDAAETLEMLLRTWGYVPVVAYDGPTALLALQDATVDVALLDIGLPVMDGYELARQIGRQAAHAHVKLIALSGYAQENDRLLARQAGFDEHLVKPVNAERLAAALGSPKHAP